MENWLVRKPRSVAGTKTETFDREEKKPVFRFQDALYNHHLTGHQRRSRRSEGDAQTTTSWMRMREEKIRSQLPEKSSDIFKGVNIYINGYTGDNKDLQLKQLVSKHGGSVSYALAQRKVTHVIVHSNLCASKLHKHLNVRKNLTKIVSSQWIMDSIANGKRLSEWKYRVLKDETQQDLLSHMVMQDGNRIENSEKQGTQSKATQQAHRAPNGRQTHPTQ